MRFTCRLSGMRDNRLGVLLKGRPMGWPPYGLAPGMKTLTVDEIGTLFTDHAL